MSSSYSIDCDEGSSDREISRKLFLRAKTWRQLVQLWVKFYSNEICLPTYYASWIGGTDNPLATFDIGKRYANISLKSGLIFSDGQQGSLLYQQREYLSGFTISSYEPVIHKICEEMNRISGMIAFYWTEDYYPNIDYSKELEDIEELDNEIRGLYVTYDEIGSLDRTSWIGEPMTSALNESPGVRSLLNYSWLNKSLRNELKEEGFIGFEFIDTIHGESRIIPTLESIIMVK